MPSPRSSRRLLALAGCAAALVLAGCAREGPVIGTPGAGPRVLTVSSAFQASVEPEVFRERVRSLTQAIERLRTETSSGWTGRQDDVTGYLTELRGGVAFGGDDPLEVADSFLAGWAEELFGVPGAQVSFREDGLPDDAGIQVLRGAQHLGEVPVLDGALVATVARADDDPRLTAIRGRVFPELQASTEAVITAKRAVAIAEESSGGAADGKPRLVLLPAGAEGTLAWEIRVLGATDPQADSIGALYYVDAVRGAVVSVRPVAIGEVAFSGEMSGPPAAAGQPTEEGGQPVEITGADRVGTALTGTGTLAGDGTITLVDQTTPHYDAATGNGGVATFDATGVEDEGLPGNLVSSATAEIADSDALAAHVYARHVVDYYADVFGRTSWDGQGGSLISSVHYGDEDYCNAHFSGTQMVYGNPCVVGGEPQEATRFDSDTAGHEITHGVTNTSANLIYTGQSGALNESFSDYLGNVIGDAFDGDDTNTYGEGACVGITENTVTCQVNPDGTVSKRYLLSGATFGDYISLLNPSIGAKTLHKIKNDSGGVHLNSAIWNSAMWTIRSRLAQIDQQPMLTSPRAQEFDQVAYAALTRGLTATSGFLDARSAVEQAATELGVDPTILQVAREVFDLHLLCDGCVQRQATGDGVATTVPPQMTPVVLGDQVAWLDLTTSTESVQGAVLRSEVGGQAATVTADATQVAIGFAGDAIVSAGTDGVVRRYDAAGVATDIDPQIGDCFLAGLAGSAEGAAWVNCLDLSAQWIDAAGAQQSAPMPAIEGFPSAVGTGGGTVAIGSNEGEIVVWKPGVDQPTLLGSFDGPILSLDAHADRVLVVSGNPREPPFTASVVDLTTGDATALSSSASAFGAAISGDHAVWSEKTVPLPGAVSETLVEEGSTSLATDTDLFLHSFATGGTYAIVSGGGQQGYPDISGSRIVWQDATVAGDDILTGSIPAGL